MNKLFSPGYTIAPGVNFPLSDEQFQSVHDATVEVLSRTGFSFECERTVDIFRKHDFRVEGSKVYFTEKDILRALETVPQNFVIRARNPERDIHMAPGRAAFGLGRGAVYIVEPDDSYRNATKKDSIDSLKLSQCLDILEHTEPLVYPFEVERENVHLWLCAKSIEHSDKACNYSSRHDIDLVAIAYGTDRRSLEVRTDPLQSPGQATVIIESPLRMTADNCENLIEYIRAGIAFHVASMPVAGTSGPCTIAGTIVLQNCENLAPIVLSQLIRPGCPVFYGSIAGNADMTSLRPRFGTPEARIITKAGVQAARHYGLLCRGDAGLTDAPAYDFQSGAQAMLSTLSVLQDGPNFILGIGLLGSYLGASLAKVILDTELIALAKRYLTPIRTDRTGLAVDVIDDVGTGGHYIAHDHTLDNYRTEFLTDSLFRSPNYEQWKTTGKRVVVHLAREKALEIIESYEQPPMDQGMKEEIDAYVKRNWIYK